MNKQITILVLILIGLFTSCQKDEDMYPDFYVSVNHVHIYECSGGYGDEPLEKALKTVYEYNKYGYAIIIQSYNIDGSYQSELARTYNVYYDQNHGVINKIIEETKYGKTEDRYTNSFNNKGMLISTGKFIFEYDENNNLIKKSGPSDTIKFFYQNNILVKQDFIDNTSNIPWADYYRTFSYNSANDFDTIKTFTSDRLHDSYEVYTYSNSPKTITVADYLTADNQREPRARRYVFDEYGRPSEIWYLEVQSFAYVYSDEFELKPFFYPQLYDVHLFELNNARYIREKYFIFNK